MTEKEIERIAEAVFQKILKYQEDWFDSDINKYKTTDREAMIAELTALNLIKAEYLSNEEYELAADIQLRINNIREELKNNKD
jgi:DNA primase large subunit